MGVSRGRGVLSSGRRFVTTLSLKHGSTGYSREEEVYVPENGRLMVRRNTPLQWTRHTWLPGDSESRRSPFCFASIVLFRKGYGSLIVTPSGSQRRGNWTRPESEVGVETPETQEGVVTGWRVRNCERRGERGRTEGRMLRSSKNLEEDKKQGREPTVTWGVWETLNFFYLG